MNTAEFKERLIQEISKCDKVKGIGQTGDINAPLVPKQSDIDVFVLCTAVPSKEERLHIYDTLKNDYEELSMEVANGGLWGYGDIFTSNEIDVMPMYFTIEEMESYLNDVLLGNHLEREGRFYPVGRLASIESIHILYEESNTFTKLQEKLKEHPESFFRKWYQTQISQVLDEEDLGRVVLRKEVLFYHQVLEDSLDHLLQALFAINHCYFPSRKRTQKAIDGFKIKPNDCYHRLLQIVENAAKSETIVDSVNELRTLSSEIVALGKIY